ncbi:MAG: TrmH family RNA methyltransferase [Pirellula sp.]|jgi:TrmH family RNA methyltransferase
MDTSIQSVKNPRIIAAAKLKQTSERKKTGLFLIEGTHAIQEICATQWPIDSVFITETWCQNHRDLSDVLSKLANCFLVPDDVLRKVAHSETPDGVIAIGKYGALGDPISPKQLSLAIALEQVQDPGNLGAVIRSSVASGSDGVFLGEGCVDPTSPKVLRASVGQWFRQPPSRVSLPTWIEHCRRSGAKVYGAAANGTCYWNLDFRGPTVFVLGNEGAGLSRDILGMVDEIVAVPMETGVESLNVAMTATLLLYEARRQRSR